MTYLCTIAAGASTVTAVLVSNVGIAVSDSVALDAGDLPAVEVVLGAGAVGWVVDVDDGLAVLVLVAVVQAGVEGVDELAGGLLEEAGGA